MPARSYEEVVAKSCDKWSLDAVNLSERLSSQLKAEVSAQVAIGRQIAAARESAYLSQPQLAKQSGPSRQTLVGLNAASEIPRVTRWSSWPTPWEWS